MDSINTLPKLGFGLGLHDRYTDDLLSDRQEVRSVDWLEIIPENYMNRGGYAQHSLNTLIDAGFQFASHGVNLSLGSVSPFNEQYLAELADIFAVVKPLWFSDHLCFSSVGPHYANDLLPLPLTLESVDHCISRIKAIQQRFDIPFLIENISYYAAFQTSDNLTEADWLTQILDGADCGLLLDVNNVFVNAQNHGYSATAFIDALPLHRVVEIHMAGHLETDDLVIDTHGEAIRPEVYELFATTFPKCPNLKGVLLERDTNHPAFDALQAELAALRSASATDMKIAA